jgi:hypothetical protein
MEFILYTIELLALSYYRRMYYEQEYRLIPPKTLRKRSCAAMTIALVACIGICLV